MNRNDITDRIQRFESFIVANDGQFLGKLSLNVYDMESILNAYGIYGSPYSATSIRNQYSIYGSPYSSLSPFNPYTSTPPMVYLRGKRVGFLTINPYLYQVIDPNRIEEWMRYNSLF